MWVLSSYYNLTPLWLYWTVLSDPVKRREYDINGMRYEYDYNIIVSNICLSNRNFVLKKCLIYKKWLFLTFFDVGLSQPLQGPYIDVQWPWHKAFDMVKQNQHHRHPSSASGTVFFKYLSLQAMLINEDIWLWCPRESFMFLYKKRTKWDLYLL